MGNYLGASLNWRWPAAAGLAAAMGISTANAQIPLTWSPTVALDANQHLEVFAAGSDGGLHQIVQQPNGPNGAWSTWVGIGGLTLGGPPFAAANANGLVAAFVKGADGTLSYFSQLPNCPGWQNLGGAIASAVAIGMNNDGTNSNTRLEVFALSPNSALNHIWQLATNGCAWASSWESFGGVGTSDPTVARNLDGRLEAFVLGNDFPAHHLYHVWQTSAGGGWSGWNSLGGYISPQPSVGQNANGTLEVFAIGNDVGSGSNTTHDWQKTPGGGWSGFNSLGNPPGQSGTLSPVVSENQDGRLEIFGVDPSALFGTIGKQARLRVGQDGIH